MKLRQGSPGMVLRILLTAIILFSSHGLGVAGDNIWQARSAVESPSPRYFQGMAHDGRRGVIVLFGGFNQGNLFEDTWEWDGSSWKQAAAPGPSPRAGPGMTYDTRRGVALLFGGGSGTGAADPLADTWEWDGLVWKRVADSGPPPRRPGTMAYDVRRGVSVLFGGFAGLFLGDTWEWDGTDWILAADQGPQPRSSHQLAYDSRREVTVLHGGYNGIVLQDTWEWDGTTWKQVATTGPLRADGAMVFDSNRGVVVMFGGNGDGPGGDTWEWDGSAWKQAATTGPSSRYDVAMAFDSGRGVAVLFGGFSGSVALNDTWEYGPCELCDNKFLRGDCDGDGRAGGNVTDALFLLTYNFLEGPRPGCLAACDADGDGLVEGQVTDAVYLLMYSFLGGPAPVAPFPACGMGELTGDAALGCASPLASCP